MPSTLALIRSMFAAKDQRSKAIAVWSGVMTGGVSLGPVIAGALLEHFWWGSVFLINLPAMALLVLLAPVLLPEYRHRSEHRFDLLGSVLSLGAVLPVVFGIKRAATEGFGAVPAGCVAAGVLVGAVFLRRQRRTAAAMIDLRLFGNRAFGASLLVNTVAMFALVGNAVFITQYLQLALGMSPLRAALWSLVPSVAVAGAAPTGAHLGGRHPRGTVMAGGLLVAAGGFVVLTFLRPTSPLALVIVGAGVLAFGIVMVLTLVTDFVMAAVGPERAGSASALVETTSEFGGALGIAILGSIGAAVYGSRLGTHLPAGMSAGQAATARQGLAGAVSASSTMHGSAAGRLLDAARQAYTDGLGAASWVGAGVLLAAACAAVVLLRGTR